MSEAPKAADFFKGVLHIWSIERPNQLAAGLAYFGMFSFAPVIYIAFVVAGLFLDSASLMENVFTRLEETLGTEVAVVVRDMVEAIDQPADAGSVLLTVVTFLVLLYAASSFFYQLQYALNRVWGVRPPEKGGTLSFIRHRVLSFLIVIALGFILIALAIVNIMGTWLESLLSLGVFDAGFRVPAFMIVATLVFAVLYKVLPDAETYWRSVWLGAGIGSAMVTIGGALVIWLLGLGKLNTGAAAAGAFILVLLLIYYVAQIFLLGAIISREYASWSELKRQAQQ